MEGRRGRGGGLPVVFFGVFEVLVEEEEGVVADFAKLDEQVSCR